MRATGIEPARKPYSALGRRCCYDRVLRTHAHTHEHTHYARVVTRTHTQAKYSTLVNINESIDVWYRQCRVHRQSFSLDWTSLASLTSVSETSGRMAVGGEVAEHLSSP